jgi:hypothetical protein
MTRAQQFLAEFETAEQRYVHIECDILREVLTEARKAAALATLDELSEELHAEIALNSESGTVGGDARDWSASWFRLHRRIDSGEFEP